jgi:hypothetical protein
MKRLARKWAFPIGDIQMVAFKFCPPFLYTQVIETSNIDDGVSIGNGLYVKTKRF